MTVRGVSGAGTGVGVGVGDGEGVGLGDGDADGAGGSAAVPPDGVHPLSARAAATPTPTMEEAVRRREIMRPVNRIPARGGRDQVNDLNWGHPVPVCENPACV